MQKTIDACHAEGGGIVRVPAGDFQIGWLGFRLLDSNTSDLQPLGDLCDPSAVGRCRAYVIGYFAATCAIVCQSERSAALSQSSA